MHSEIVKFDDSLYPIIRLYTDKKKLTHDEVVSYTEIMTEFYKKHQGKNIVLVYDLNLSGMIDGRDRITISEWLDREQQTIKNAVAGVAYVQKNFFMKVILQGIFAKKTPAWKHKVVRSFDEAVEWANKILEEYENN